ncbi:MAG: hypothetical protein ACPGWR_30500, partial [Ardenticatenaceae bacterium]
FRLKHPSPNRGLSPYYKQMVAGMAAKSKAERRAWRGIGASVRQRAPLAMVPRGSLARIKQDQGCLFYLSEQILRYAQEGCLFYLS